MHTDVAKQNVKNNVKNISTKNRIKKELAKNYDLYLMALPMILYYIIFHYWPLYGIQIAFRDYNPALGFIKSPFVGLKHFRNFFSLPIAFMYIKNTLRITITELILYTPVPIILALMLNSVNNNKIKTRIQTTLYLPQFISTVVAVAMIRIFLNPFTGIINIILNKLGVDSIDFINRPELYVFIYVISAILQYSGWSSLIYTGALTGINPELYEAAKIDGASKFQQIIYIELPVVSQTFTILLILKVGGIMSLGWEKSYLLQTPFNIEVSEIVSTYTYKVGIISAQYSYSSAIGLFNSVVNFILLLIANFLSRQVSDSSLW
jgi:putative aldouronate transport system permease protein